MLPYSISELFSSKYKAESKFISDIGLKICGKNVNENSEIELIDTITDVIVGCFENMEKLSIHLNTLESELSNLAKSIVVKNWEDHITSLKKVFDPAYLNAINMYKEINNL